MASFVLTATLGKILTLYNLRKAKSMCYIGVTSKRNGESVNHLLIHCEVTSVLQNSIFDHFKLVWVMPWGVAELSRVGGGDSVAKKAKHWGKWLKYPYYGAFGDKEMTVTSKIVKKIHLRSFFLRTLSSFLLVFFRTSYTGWLHILLFLALVSTIFRISLLLIARCFSWCSVH